MAKKLEIQNTQQNIDVAVYALEDMGKPIGVADYQLIVQKEKLQKILAEEIKAFGEEKENLNKTEDNNGTE